MFARAISHGFKADYVLVDSWFFCLELLEKCSPPDRYD